MVLVVKARTSGGAVRVEVEAKAGNAGSTDETGTAAGMGTVINPARHEIATAIGTEKKRTARTAAGMLA